MNRTTLAAIAALALAACTGGEGGDRTVLVFAAASLSDAFGAIEVAYEEADPGVDVVVNVAGSSTLREQILEGAPADVFASASPAIMDELVAAGAVSGAPRVVATNRLQLAVPAGNPAGVRGLADLADDDLLVGICSAGVPCGGLAREAFALADIEPSIDTEEPDVRALLAKVAAGELDAGLVYETDVLAAGDTVEGVGSPDDLGVSTAYPIALLADASSPELAAQLVAFVRSDAGRSILAEAGFGPS